MRRDVMPGQYHINENLRIPERMMLKFETDWWGLRNIDYKHATVKPPIDFVKMLRTLKGTKDISAFLSKTCKLRDKDVSMKEYELLNHICELLEEAIVLNQSEP